MDSFGDAKVFKTLDALAGYWQMNIRKQDRHETASVRHAGNYQYKRVPLGLTIAPATFQLALKILLTQFSWKTCLAYIENLIIYLITFEEHIRYVDEILKPLKDRAATFQISRGHFFQHTIEYLGHTIKPGKLEIDSTNPNLLRHPKPPTNKSYSVRSLVYATFTIDSSHDLCTKPHSVLVY